MADDLADPVDIDEDELPEEDRIPESEGGGIPMLTAGGHERPILAAMVDLGPCTTAEIADKLGRVRGNVATQMRQYEQRNEVHRTGRMVNEAGARGGPQVEWALGPAPATANGTGPTGPTDVLAGPPSSIEVERDRVRTLSARVAALAAQVEAREDERDQSREEARAARDEARANLEELRQRGQRLGELEQEVDRLQAVARRAAERPLQGQAETEKNSDMRERYFALLLEMAGRDGAEEHVFDRLERLVLGDRDG